MAQPKTTWQEREDEIRNSRAQASTKNVRQRRLRRERDIAAGVNPDGTKYAGVMDRRRNLRETTQEDRNNSLSKTQRRLENARKQKNGYGSTRNRIENAFKGR